MNNLLLYPTRPSVQTIGHLYFPASRRRSRESSMLDINVWRARIGHFNLRSRQSLGWTRSGDRRLLELRARLSCRVKEKQACVGKNDCSEYLMRGKLVRYDEVAFKKDKDLCTFHSGCGSCWEEPARTQCWWWTGRWRSEITAGSWTGEEQRMSVCVCSVSSPNRLGRLSFMFINWNFPMIWTSVLLWTQDKSLSYCRNMRNRYIHKINVFDYVGGRGVVIGK